MELCSRERLASTLATLRPVLDIVEGRVEDVEPPSWCEQRGWSEFLLSLSDADLQRCEAHGLDLCIAELDAAPASLRDLARAVTAAAEPPFFALGDARFEGDGRQVSIRKRQQLAALLAAIDPMARRSARVVDVGAGRGALTRFCAVRFERTTLGIERSVERLLVATRNAPPGAALEFRTSDVLRDGLDLKPDDLAVGLHACGELGDALTASVAVARCHLALIPCCLQKISAPSRAPLSRAAQGLAFSRGCLGLTNQTAQAEGVETSLERALDARMVRYALSQLLRENGVEVATGEEMRGVNRRRAQRGLSALAARAFSLRGLAPPSAASVARHERSARARFDKIRRLALPRSMLSRLVELSIALDRASVLEERGLHTRVGTLFARSVSPRNLAIFAGPDAMSLPAYAAG